MSTRSKAPSPEAGLRMRETEAGPQNVNERVSDAMGRTGVVRAIWVERGGECWVRVQFDMTDELREAPVDCFTVIS